MPGTGPPATAYGRDAEFYDARTAVYDNYRGRVVDRMPLRPGDVVLDVGCGTGLCFALLRRRVGPAGAIFGVDNAPKMLALAAERVAAHGWRNVVLIESAIEDAELPTVDHALFCAVHDILQSPAALDNVIAHVRKGVAAVGGKWAPPWAIAVNAGVLALHAPYVSDFAGFDRPWAPLAERVPDLAVEEVAMGGGYLAAGNVRRDVVPHSGNRRSVPRPP